MGALVRVNGGIEKGQWASMGCIEKGQWVLVRVNGGIEKGQWGQWSVSMGVGQHCSGLLKRVNGGVSECEWGIEKGEWRHWSGSMRAIEKGQVRQGLGCGSDRRLSYRAVSTTLQGRKLYLAGL